MFRSLAVNTDFLTPFVEEVALYMMGNPGTFMNHYVTIYTEIYIMPWSPCLFASTTLF